MPVSSLYYKQIWFLLIDTSQWKSCNFYFTYLIEFVSWNRTSFAIKKDCFSSSYYGTLALLLNVIAFKELAGWLYPLFYVSEKKTGKQTWGRWFNPMSVGELMHIFESFLEIYPGGSCLLISWRRPMLAHWTNSIFNSLLFAQQCIKISVLGNPPLSTIYHYSFAFHCLEASENMQCQYSTVCACLCAHLSWTCSNSNRN